MVNTRQAKRRVLFVTGFNYFPQSTGGSESSTHELCVAITKSGFMPAVLAALFPRLDRTYLRNRLYAKLTGQYAPADKYSSYAVYRGWEVATALDEVATTFRPDVVVIQSGEPAKLTNKALSLGLKTILYLRDVEFANHGGVYQNNAALRVIANSEFTSERFLDRFGIPSIVIPPTISSENYLSQRPRKERGAILFINPHPYKGVDLALKLAKLNPQFDFLFVESWHLATELRQKYLAQASQLSNVRWLPQQQDMRPVYEQAAILLVPSICEEAWARVVSEAQINGIPVLASNRGGLPESVGPGGITLDPEQSSIETWSRCLRQMIVDEDLYRYFSKAARAYSERPVIQPDALTRRFLTVLNQFLDA